MFEPEEPDMQRGSKTAADTPKQATEDTETSAQGRGFSSQGPIPPVQSKRDAAPTQTASDMAFGGGAGGEKLPEPVRQKMEGSYKADFGGVRVHQGGKADALGSQALAQGEDLHFAKGKYDPNSKGGQELIGHELSHVVQQRGGRVDAAQHAGPVVADAGLEREADEQGAAAARGEPAAKEAAPAPNANAKQPRVEGGDAADPALADAHAIANEGISAMGGTPGLVVNHPPADFGAHGQAAGGAQAPRVRPTAGAVGSLQLQYDMCTGQLSLIGWVWAGAGAVVHTPIGEQWYGAYTFHEGTICETKLDFMPKLPHGPKPPQKQAEGEKKSEGGWGIAGFPMLIAPGKMSKFKQAGLEVGVLVSPDAHDFGADIELIALLDVLGYLGPVAAGAKRVVEIANKYASKFGLSVEMAAGIDASANVHGWKSPNGLVVDDAKVAGGGFVAMGVDLPHSKSALPAVH